NFKVLGIYELPFGRGKKWMSKGVAATALGNWRVSGIGYYASGQPLPLGTTGGTPSGLFAGPHPAVIATYDGWRAPTKGGSFDPSVDRFVQPASFFPTQTGLYAGTTQYFGNMTRYNPKFRQFPNLSENVSVTKAFQFTERVRLDFRAEA